MKKIISLLFVITFCKSSYAQDNIIKQLSYCGAISLAQSNWNESKGDKLLGQTLQQGAYTFAKITVVYGESVGYSEKYLLDLNKSSLINVRKEIDAGFFFDAQTLKNKNENCLDIIRGNKKLLDLWQKFFI